MIQEKLFYIIIIAPFIIIKKTKFIKAESIFINSGYLINSDVFYLLNFHRNITKKAAKKSTHLQKQ